MYYILFNANINYQFHKYYAFFNYVLYVYFYNFFCCNRFKQRKIIMSTIEFIKTWFESSTIKKNFRNITTTKSDDVDNNNFLTTTNFLLTKTAKNFSTREQTTVFCSTIIVSDFRLLSTTTTKNFCERTTIFCSTIIVDDFRLLSTTTTKIFCKRTTIYCSIKIIAKSFCERFITIIFWKTFL